MDNDNPGMGRAAVDYLYHKGHRRILFVTDNQEAEVGLERYQGYQEGMRQHALLDQAMVLFDRRMPETLDAFIHLLQDQQVTALVVIGDLLSLRIIQFLSYYGLRVPDDVSMISFNNSIFSTMLHPYLTTFDINVKALGQTSLLRLLDVIASPGKPVEKTTVPVTLKERESVRTLDI